MRFTKSILILLLVLVIGALSRCDEIDDYLKAEMQRQHIPGLSLAIVRDGRVVKAEGYGLANLELNVPARPETVYKIASISKQLIAAGVLLLVEEGKIGLDDKISGRLADTPEAWREITIRHLLTHTSGIVREAPAFSGLKVQPDAEVIKSAYPLPLVFAPGEKWQYCNVGYFALAEIIQQVSGKPWQPFLEERIFAPLEMCATRATTMEDLVPNRAGGYAWRGKQYQNASLYLAVRPSGAFLSNVLDLARWDAALDSERVLKQSTREAMWTPVSLNDGTRHPYGFGWFLGRAPGLVRHGGSLPGFRSELARFRDDKLTIIILTNSESARPGPMAMHIAKQLIPGLPAESASPSEN